MSRQTQDLQGRIALVTGAEKGVGKVIAQQLAERGAHVLINCLHSYEQAKQTPAELEALGASVDVFRASLAKRDQVDRMFDEIDERFGYLDVLVNNAAYEWLGPVDELGEQHFTKAIDTNLLGSFSCARRAARMMAARGGGCIVSISSIGGGMVPGNYLVVATSKAALEALTRYLAVEFAPLNVRVNTASGGLIDGDLANLLPRAEEMSLTARSAPLGGLATAEDLSGVVHFLTSDQSRWVTGQVVLADGGPGLGHALMSAPGPISVGVDRAGDQPPSTSSEQLLGPPVVGPTDIALAAASPGADLPVVVVGMGMVAPGANSPDEYWQLAMRGAELFVDVPPDRWKGNWFHDDDKTAPDKTPQSKSGFITGFEPDPDLAEEISRGAVTTDEATRWLRHLLMQALPFKRGKPRSNPRTGVDGRRRPVNGADRRRRAAQLVARQPHAPVREIAKEPETSVATALDVRDELPGRKIRYRPDSIGSPSAHCSTPRCRPVRRRHAARDLHALP